MSTTALGQVMQGRNGETVHRKGPLAPRLVTEWVCDFCGYGGPVVLPSGDTVDSLQCPMCGEPVTLVAEYWVEA